MTDPVQFVINPAWMNAPYKAEVGTYDSKDKSWRKDPASHLTERRRFVLENGEYKEVPEFIRL